MTDKEKLKKLKKLADAMYYAAQHLTTDASRLHKAMDEYHQFIIHECKEEPVSEDLEKFADESSIDYRKMRDYQGLRDPITLNEVEEATYNGIIAGAQWQKEKMTAKAIDVEVHVDAGGYPYIPQMELYDYDKDISLAKEGDKYKVVLIKEE